MQKIKYQRSAILDIVRVIAAMEVVLSHLRSFIFHDFNQLSQVSLITKLFYYATGFGHQAVIVFFVLSGYLVGGSVLSADYKGFWERYFMQRMSRLWIVLIPCLIATLFWNKLGFYTGGADYLNGHMNPPVTSAPRDVGVRLDGLAFLGNMLFLQTITLPVFGDNGPLWSLANEFWYYVVFPLFFWGIKRNSEISVLGRLLSISLGLVILILLPSAMIAGFVVWLMGVAVAAISKSKINVFFADLKVGITCLLICLVVFHISRSVHFSDIFLGCSFALSLPFLMRVYIFPEIISRFGGWFSDFSYTLYLAHFPLMAFIWCTFLNSQRLPPSFFALQCYFSVFVIIVIYSYIMSLVFERNTGILRRLFAKALNIK